ncbi:MAG: hypothetical protein N3E37_04235 [Candidatus Micrarchaeota archaeon]|nr:hypothetical protein [Candidatus Micrarchaeota archaeon]
MKNMYLALMIVALVTLVVVDFAQTSDRQIDSARKYPVAVESREITKTNQDDLKTNQSESKPKKEIPKISPDDVQIFDSNKKIIGKNLSKVKEKLQLLLDNYTSYEEHVKLMLKSKTGSLKLMVQMLRNVCENTDYCSDKDYVSKILELQKLIENLEKDLNSTQNITHLLLQYKELNKRTNNLTKEIKTKLLLISRNLDESKDPFLRNKTKLMIKIMCKGKELTPSNLTSEDCINACHILTEKISELLEHKQLNTSNLKLNLTCMQNGVNCKLKYHFKDGQKQRGIAQSSENEEESYYLKISENESEDNIFNREISQTSTNLVIKTKSTPARMAKEQYVIQGFEHNISNQHEYLKLQMKCMYIMNNLWNENYGLSIMDDNRKIAKELIEHAEKIKIKKQEILKDLNLSKDAKIVIPSKIRAIAKDEIISDTETGNETANRGIEKKDIRRGMVIAKPLNST